MRVLVTADHPVLKRIDKYFDNNTKCGEISEFLAELEYLRYENIEVIEK